MKNTEKRSAKPTDAGTAGNAEQSNNKNGGVNGGITNGMPLVFRTVLKPTPSIYKEQHTVDYISRQDAELQIRGRHDPCIVPRAVPCIEAAAAIAVYDALLGQS